MLSKKAETKQSTSKLPKKHASSRDKQLEKEDSYQKPRCKSGAAKKNYDEKTQAKTIKRNHKDQVKDLLRESYTFVKEENHSLHHQLRKKSKKIQELREALTECQNRLTKCQQDLFVLKSQGKNQQTKSEERLGSSRKKYEQMIRQSQDIAKQSLDKYRKLEREMEQQKQKYQKEIENLRAVNQLITKRSAAETPTQHSTDKKRTKSKSKKESSHKRIDFDLSQLQSLKIKEEAWIRKERDLMNMLEQISDKVASFQFSLKEAQQNAKFYKKQWEQTLQKYEKSKQNNQQLKHIVGEFMNAAVKKDEEVHSVKKMLRNILNKEERSMEKGVVRR